MAFEVIWTSEAKGDLDAIVEYLIEMSGGVQAASHLLGELDDAVHRIGEHPEMYALSRDKYLSWLGLRPCFFMRYVLLYRIDGGEVIITRIFHGSQDYARLV